MRCFFLTCGIAIKLLIICTTSIEAAEVAWGVVSVEGSEGQRLSYFAANGRTVGFSDDAGSRYNFGIGCANGQRYIFLTTGKLEKDVGRIAPNGFADIELHNGKSEIKLRGRLAYIQKSNAINFIAEDIEKNQFVLIANRLMSGTDKLGFRIREGSHENPGFMFAGEIGVGKKAPAAVADALRNCGFV
jgi:hypothetical protein